jgi:hypothetical protein
MNNSTQAYLSQIGLSFVNITFNFPFGYLVIFLVRYQKLISIKLVLLWTTSLFCLTRANIRLGSMWVIVKHFRCVLNQKVL